jgi:hypothetical protein
LIHLVGSLRADLEEIVGQNGLLKQLTKALVERAMNAEMSHHLGKHAAGGRGSGNNRNGKGRKKIQRTLTSATARRATVPRLTDPLDAAESPEALAMFASRVVKSNRDRGDSARKGARSWLRQTSSRITRAAFSRRIAPILGTFVSARPSHRRPVIPKGGT